MAINKKAQFTKTDQELAEISKALSHPARIAILRILAKSDTCICGDIVDSLPLAQSTVSQHLKELKDSGLIKGSVDGPRSCYCIDHEKWKSLNDVLINFLEELSELQTNKNCC